MMEPRLILRAALQGEEVTPVEAIVLFQNYADYAREIHEIANLFNQRINKNVVTYTHTKHICYTNICRYSCRFCSFFRKKRKPGAFSLTIDQIIEKIKKTPKLSQVMIYGGVNFEFKFNYYCDMIKEIRRQFPRLHIQAFSPLEVHFMAKRSKQSIREVFVKLKDCGLDSMTGTDAEILNDKLRKKICPDKIRSADWAEIIKTAHKCGVKTSATILFGHIEDEIHLGEHLEVIRSIQKETGGFTEFVPIPFSMHDRRFTDLSRLVPMRRREALLVARDDSDYERNAALRLLSISRIYFRDALPTIQSGWFRLGMDTALEALTVGANDMGETVFDDSAIKTLRSKSPTTITPERIKKTIAKAGKNLKHRSL